MSWPRPLRKAKVATLIVPFSMKRARRSPATVFCVAYLGLDRTKALKQLRRHGFPAPPQAADQHSRRRNAVADMAAIDDDQGWFKRPHRGVFACGKNFAVQQ